MTPPAPLVAHRLAGPVAFGNEYREIRAMRLSVPGLPDLDVASPPPTGITFGMNPIPRLGSRCVGTLRVGDTIETL